MCRSMRIRSAKSSMRKCRKTPLPPSRTFTEPRRGPPARSRSGFCRSGFFSHRRAFPSKFQTSPKPFSQADIV
ncbi:hypothetical protein BVIET440_280005 [Burkholderia vietnamiensis]|nr:hypothetical protein BVI2075_740051 [Burkholderia vietnamiensis]